jgi:hypothetical protein
MRLEATVPDSRGSALQELADQLGLSRSQIVDEALSLFLKAVLEIRRGRKLLSQDPSGAQATCELTTPTLTTLEWALDGEKLLVPREALGKMKARIDAKAAPGTRLRAAAKRRGR